MTRPLQAPRHLRPMRSPSGLHYSWIIVGILVVVQVVGSAISQSAGVMVAPLRTLTATSAGGSAPLGRSWPCITWWGRSFPRSAGGWASGMGRGTSCWRAACCTGAVWSCWGWSGSPGTFPRLQRVALPDAVHLPRATDGRGERLVPTPVGPRHGHPLGGGRAGVSPARTSGERPAGPAGLGTFWSLGVVGGGLILSLTVFFRNRPADLGLMPYGATAADPPEVVRSPAIERLRRQVFTQHMRRTRAFWHLPLIHGLGCAGHGIVLL